MRDLNLGPDSKKLVERFNAIDQDQRPIHRKAEEIYYSALAMKNMLECWNTVCWCWVDNCPAQICSGPHFKVKYADTKLGLSNRNVEVIEPYNKIGETFPDVPYTVERP